MWAHSALCKGSQIQLWTHRRHFLTGKGLAKAIRYKTLACKNLR